MKKIKLIATDLDGTALMSDRVTISDRLLNAFAQAYRRGIHIVPITGRQYVRLPAVLHTELPWRELCVLNNGGEVCRFCDGGIIHAIAMPFSEAKQVIELAGQRNVPIELNDGEKIVMTQKDADLLRECSVEALRYHIQNDLPESLYMVDDLVEYIVKNDVAVVKLTLPYIWPECRDELFQELNKLSVSCVWGSINGMEVTAKEATKGQALLWACRYFNIQPEESIAFGDSGNDISMLQAAGIGVAMGNSPADVKAIADLVTESNVQDGVAKAIERLILNE